MRRYVTSRIVSATVERSSVISGSEHRPITSRATIRRNWRRRNSRERQRRWGSRTGNRQLRLELFAVLVGVHIPPKVAAAQQILRPIRVADERFRKKTAVRKDGDQQRETV